MRLNLSPTIAKLGENAEFVAFNAHGWFAAFVVHLACEHGVPRVVAAVIALALAGWKEFYFDARQEKNPPQTFRDNAMDFAGYVVGIGLGVL